MKALQMRLNHNTQEILHSYQIWWKPHETALISDRTSWMTTKKFQLNDDKTELMLVIPKKLHKHTLLPQSMSVCNVTINVSPSVRDLGLLCVLNNISLPSTGQSILNFVESVPFVNICLSMQPKCSSTHLSCRVLTIATPFSPDFQRLWLESSKEFKPTQLVYVLFAKPTLTYNNNNIVHL